MLYTNNVVLTVFNVYPVSVKFLAGEYLCVDTSSMLATYAANKPHTRSCMHAQMQKRCIYATFMQKTN